MKRIHAGLVLACCLLALSAPPAHALGPLSIGFGGGVTVPMGDAKDALKEGFHVRGILDAKLPVLPFGLRGALGFEKFSMQDLAAVSAAYTDGKSEVLSGLGGVTFSLLSVGPVRPYITASVGAFHFKSEVDSLGTEIKVKQTSFGIDAGVGAKFGLGPAKGFVEARIENAFTDQGWNPVFAAKEKSLLVPVTFGLTF
jgi:hypothetical protein